MTFARFMEYCLYDPGSGYYRRGRPVFGPAGDYFTSPYTHRFFGETLAQAFSYYFESLGGPRPFHLVELGAGEGILGRDVLSAMRGMAPAAYESCRYVPVEIESVDLPPSIQGVVFSNEFFDALPVHRVRVRGTSLLEIYVRFEENEWKEVEGELSDKRILDYMKKGFPEWRDGWLYEVNLRMVEVLRDLNRRIRSGYVVTLDYGYDTKTYGAVDRPDGTLLAYRRHEARTDPYTWVGEQDLTAHVNFGVMQALGSEFGWINHDLLTQRRYLMQWGLKERLLEEEKQGLFREDRIRERLGLKTLLIPGGISDTIQVLVQEVRRTSPAGRSGDPEST